MRDVKHRYVVVRVKDSSKSPEEIEGLVTSLILQLFGIDGLSRVLPKVVYRNDRGISVIRVRREGLKIFRASLTLDRSSSIYVMKTTGTLRKASRIADSWRDEV
ncbi:MAG: Rpp14/Pop5 family protein [Infirmifilum sp.]